MGVVVGKYINGIALNPLEYLLDSRGGLVVFETEEKAKRYLEGQGYTDGQIYGFVFEKKDLELDDGQIARIDEIHNAVFELCKVLAEDPELEWDMHYIAEITDLAANELCQIGNSVRYPAVVTDRDGKQHIEEYYDGSGDK